LTDVLLVGPALEHKFLRSVLIILKEPSDSDQLLSRHVLGEPEVNDDEDGYEFIDDQLAEDSGEHSSHYEESDDYCLEDCVDDETDGGIGRLDVHLLLLLLLL
jgi:hypothetical protein